MCRRVGEPSRASRARAAVGSPPGQCRQSNYPSASFSSFSHCLSLFLLFSPSRSLSPSRDAFGHIVSVLLSFSLFLSPSPFVSSFSPSCPTLFSSSSYSRTILLVSLTVSSLVHLTSPLPPGGLLSSTRPLGGAKSLRALSSRPSFSPFPSSVHLHARACCKSIKKFILRVNVTERFLILLRNCQGAEKRARADSHCAVTANIGCIFSLSFSFSESDKQSKKKQWHGAGWRESRKEI